ncbi:MAG: Gfo/Idh/MocA family oxidoreductase [Planctomycetota bacterium]
MTEIRIAIVGAGGIAQRHGLAVQRNPHAELAAVVDRNAEQAEGFAKAWGGKPYPDLEACLDQVDAVYVLTPPSVRKGLALTALAAGKHLLCEKPLASTREDAEAIRDAAAAAPVVSAMGLNMRHRTGFERLRDIVQSGRLGSPYHFWRQRFGMGPGAGGRVTDDNWRTDPSFVCGMTVESFSHDADMLRWVMDDELASVSAIVYGTVPDLPAFDNNAHAQFTLRSGGSALITASWSSRIGFNSCGVLGETGTAFLYGTALGNNGSWCSRELHVKSDEDEFETVEMIQDDLDERSYLRQTNDFIDAVRSGGTPRSSIADGCETLRISEAVLHAAQTRTIVELDR